MSSKVQVYLSTEQKLLSLLEKSKLTNAKELIRLAKIGAQLISEDKKEASYKLFLFDSDEGFIDEVVENKASKELPTPSEPDNDSTKKKEKAKNNRGGFNGLIS
ncbi:hypothetical protein N9R79_09925 [Vibrio sp.]|nr:hypothetical protein [Vibrio sp.]